MSVQIRSTQAQREETILPEGMPDAAAEPIDWESTLARYHDSLLNVLRGFGTGLAGLDTWVPEEDTVDSIVSLAEAVRDAGGERVSVRMRNDTVASLDVDRLGKQAGKLGNSCLRSQGNGWLLEIAFLGAGESEGPTRLRDAAAVPRLRTDSGGSAPCSPIGTPGTFVLDGPYLAPLHRRLGSTPRAHHGRVEAVHGTPVEASLGPATLHAVVDSARHLLRQVRWESSEEASAPLLEMIARTAEGLPIDEAAEHGVQRLEADLRELGQDLPVDGIFLPERIYAAFDDANRLLRGLAADYRRQVDDHSRVNTYEPPLSAEWRRKSDEERASAVEAALRDFAHREGARLVRIEARRRVVFAFGGEVDPQGKQQRLVGLEKHLQAHVERGLEVYLDPRTDANKLRQQKGVKL
jgi:hypothetical protein